MSQPEQKNSREAMIAQGASALYRTWPTLGIVSRAVVYRHPTKFEIAEVVLRAALDGELPPEPPPRPPPSLASRVVEALRTGGLSLLLREDSRS